MTMRRLAIALTLTLCAVATARADTFSGFSGVDRPYLVNQDRVCTPLLVASSAATGAPVCTKAAADVIAHLSIKPPIVQSGARASFVAQAAGRAITVSRKAGGVAVTWSAPDPIVKIVETYASQYDDRVAVAYTVRRAGKEVTDIVAFDLGQNQTAVKDATPPRDVAPPKDPDASPDAPRPDAVAPPDDPKIAKAAADARAAGKPRSLAAWRAVLSLDAAHSEALFQLAAAELAARHTAEALAALATLAASNRSDAIEWLVEARFHPAFQALRGDAKFRTTVGLDRKAATTYERLMGFGGGWEQTGTSCDKPEVRFTAGRDRSFKLRVKTSCEGAVYDTSFKGTWRIAGDRVVLVLPNQGKQASASDEATCGFETAGDEEAMRCALGHDLDFSLLPTRR
jgi:hypothetical protein